MNLKELEKMGAFVPDAPVKKDIRFTLDTDEEFTATIYVRKLSIGDYEKVFATKDDRTARAISAAVMLGDGKERIPADKAYSLHPGLANAMLEAFYEVNGGKKSPTPIGSSTT